MLENIEQRLAKVRESHYVKRAAVAKKLGISRQHYNDIETGKKKPSNEIARKMYKLMVEIEQNMGLTPDTAETPSEFYVRYCLSNKKAKDETVLAAIREWEGRVGAEAWDFGFE